MMIYFGLVFAGAFAWSLTEYLMHRFVGHGCKGRVRLSREHLAHHSNPNYFTPTYQKVALGLILMALLFALSRLLWGDALAAGFTGGFISAYTFYEVLHRRIHTHAPMGRYGQMVRQHHLSHHFSDARLRHGVTSRIWDRAFGTHGPISQVRVPRKLATRWMLGPDGELLSRYRTSYQLIGRR
jgi:sterol desaturase/sphingolipid hydroxylase (fatty acid hydroxylase superfamily)